MLSLSKYNTSVLIRLFCVTLLAVILTSCAVRRTQTEVLAFPADLSQPFLTLEHTLGEEPAPAEGFVKRLMLKIIGPREVLSPLRPVAVVINDLGNVYVIDADAACVLYYKYDNGKLKNVKSFGSGMFSAPRGIAISDDVIYVSDAESSLIHRFDRNFNALEPLKIEGLQRPGQLIINPHTGELFIVDTPAQQILVIDAHNQVKAQINNAEIGRPVLKAPISVAFSGKGNIVILDGMTRRVETLTPKYEYLSGFGSYDRVPGSFSYPRGITISSDDYIFVSDAAFGNVQIFDSKGALLYFFGETGVAAGEFLLPAALTFDAHDNLYVVDQYNSRVQVYHYNAQGR